MAQDTAAVPGGWRAGRPARPRAIDRKRVSAKKWLGATLLSVLLLLAAGCLAWIIWQLVRPAEFGPEFVPLFVSGYEHREIPPIPQARADREMIGEQTSLSSIDPAEKNEVGLTREVILDRLERLHRKQPGDAVVVYLSTHAKVDSSGSVQFLAYDSDPFASKTLVPLKSVLTALRECPAQRKLLILDVMADRGPPLELGGTEDGVADLIPRELARKDAPGKLDDPHLAVLASCSPGEVALWSEPFRQSVFGHFFIKGLGDPEADTDQDHAISLQELSQYLTREVDGWALQHRGLRQRPVLIGSTAYFPLSSLNRRKSKPAGSIEKTEGTGPREQPVDESKSAEKTSKDPEQVTEEKKNPVDEKGKEKDKTSKGRDKDSENSTGSEPSYAPWLAGGWQLYERWAEGHEIAIAPRLVRQLELNLLRGERDWRLGGDSKKLEAVLGTVLSTLDAKMDQARREKRPPERSVGQALAFGRSADEPLVKALTEILERERHPDLLTPADQRKIQRFESVRGFGKSLKGKASLDLAMAIVEAAKDGRFDKNTLQLLDEIVVASTFPRDVIELRLLQQLAERAQKVRQEDWNEEMARQIWDTVILAEKANNRPRTFPWLRGLLDEADALRHEAEVRLHPRALGFASEGQVARSWDQVAKAYAFIDGCQTKILEAQAACVLARATLPAYLQFFEASPVGEGTRTWLEAGQNVQALEGLLDISALDAQAPAPTRDHLEMLNSQLTDKIQQLRAQLDELRQPFRTESVKALIRRCKENLPEPLLGGQIEAILSTPFLKASDRAELWRASLTLDGRLGELPVRGSDSTVDSADLLDRVVAVGRLAGRRKEWLLALVKMADPAATTNEFELRGVPSASAAGAPEAKGADEQSMRELLARNWADLARFSQAAHAGIIDALSRAGSKPGPDRPAWIAPAFLLDENSNPIRRGRDQESLANWTWLAARYRHESADLHGFADLSDNFFNTAALECPRESETQQEPILRLSIREPAQTTLRLSSRQPSTECQIEVALGGTDGVAPQKVAVVVLEPDDSRLQVSAPEPAEYEVVPLAPKPTRIAIGWDESRGLKPKPPPSGFIVQARLPGGRAFHLLVPIDIVPVDDVPRLALRTDPAQVQNVSVDPLRLRTLPDKQPFFVVVRNPSQVDRKVTVEIMAGDSVIASSAEKDKPPLEAKAGSTVVVPSFGEPTGKPNEPLLEAPQNLSLRLRDAVSGQEYERLNLRPVIASPLEYIELVQAQFIPPSPGATNRLEVSLHSLPQMTGPPCRVRLDIPADPELFPGYVEPPIGKLEGLVEPGGKPLKLTAENIKLKAAARDDGKFSLSVDGINRALWYQTRFVLQGQVQRVEQVRDMRVRFQPELIVKPDKPAKLIVRFKIDNAPPDARLVFRLGHFENGEFKTDLDDWRERAQSRHIGFDPKGKGGALLFEASVDDWSREFDVAGLRGPKILYAFLFDARERQVLDKWGMQFVFDDVPPQNPQIIDLPKEIEPTATRLTARATVKPPESKIKDVSFIVNPGVKGDFAKAETENQLIPGKVSTSDPDTWEAMIPVPKGASGKLVVSVRFTSGVGLSGFDHGEVTIRQPAPDPAEGAAKPAPEKPGAIEGVVTENDIKQPGLVVLLMNPKPKDKENPVMDQKITGADGSYSFPDLKPGPYRVFCKKLPTNRSDTKDVTVESGKTVKQNLDLLLP